MYEQARHTTSNPLASNTRHSKHQSLAV